jgi:hypothetical protein
MQDCGIRESLLQTTLCMGERGIRESLPQTAQCMGER